MSETKSNVPKLRFPGFTDPWEQRRFGELYARRGEKNDGSFELDKVISVANMRFNPSAKAGSDDYLRTYNVMRVGDMAFEGHENAEFSYGRFVVNDIGDGIVSHVFEVLKPICEYDLQFWKHYIHCEWVLGRILLRSTKATTMMHSIVIDDFLREPIMVPLTMAEQRAIGALFRDVDSLITLRQRELEHTKLMKRGLLQKMFPKAGADVPELRFPGFTDPWEQRKFGEFYRKGDEKNSNLEFGIEKTISVSSMSWNPNGNGAAENSLPSYKILRKGDIAFEGNRTKGHPYGKLVINDIGAGIMSSRFRTLAAKEPMCIPFWKPFLTVDSVFRRIYINCTKRGTLMTELVVPELLESTVPIPSLSEQRLIGALFRDVDSLITLRQRELEHTKLMKKALLQQMFV